MLVGVAVVAVILVGIFGYLSKTLSKINKIYEKTEILECEDHKNKVNTVESSCSKIENKVSNLKCDSNSEKINEIILSQSRFDERSKGLEDNISRINNSIDAVYLAITGRSEQSLIKKEFIIANSPIKLTDKGEHLLIEMGAKYAIDEREDYFFDEIRERNFSSEGDIESICKIIIKDEYQGEIFRDVRDYLYNNPVYDGMRMDSNVAITIISIYLSAKYLKYLENSQVLAMA